MEDARSGWYSAISFGLSLRERQRSRVASAGWAAAPRADKREAAREEVRLVEPSYELRGLLCSDRTRRQQRLRGRHHAQPVELEERCAGLDDVERCVGT